MKFVLLTFLLSIFFPNPPFSQANHSFIVNKFKAFYNAGQLDSIRHLYSTGDSDGTRHIWNEANYENLFRREFGEVLKAVEYMGISDELINYKLTFNKSVQRMSFNLNEVGKFGTLRFTTF